MNDFMSKDEPVVRLTRELISYASVSNVSNEAVSRFVSRRLEGLGFVVEWHSFVDDRGATKVSLVAKRGDGFGGICYLAHTDVVPADDWSLDWCGAFDPGEREGKLFGRGSCDMKGSLACALIAAERISAAEQVAPIYFVVTADEEVGMQGAKQVDAESDLFEEMVQHDTMGIVGEPTELEVIHAHKGAQRFHVRSKGKSAHTSTGEGINANHQLFPALPEFLRLYQESEETVAFHNQDFKPPTLSWNMTILNEPVAVNITPSLSQLNIFIRTMPSVDHFPLVDKLRAICQRYTLELEILPGVNPWSVPSESDWVREMLRIVDRSESRTVCFATDAGVLQRLKRLVVCGPGSIEQAHRSDEFISLEQLARGARVYEDAFRRWACSR